MENPKVYADFQNADSLGRLRLNCIGTLEDLARQQVQLREGLVLTVYSDDVNPYREVDELTVEGVVAFSEAENCWVADIEWTAIRHASALQLPNRNGNQEVDSEPLNGAAPNSALPSSPTARNPAE